MNDTHHTNTNEERRGLLWGVALVAVGLLLTVIELDFFRADIGRLWPLIPLAVGVVIALSGGADALHNGLFVTGIGAWMLVSTLELGGLDWSTSWPLIPILAGIVRLAVPEGGKSRAGGIMPIVIGCWLLINTLELWGLDWGSSWPLLLVLVGVGIISKALVALATPRPQGGES